MRRTPQVGLEDANNENFFEQVQINNITLYILRTVHWGERNAAGVIPGADTMSGAGADTLMCMRGLHRAWDTGGREEERVRCGREWQCAQRGCYGTGSEAARSSACGDLTRLPDCSPTLWVIVSTSLLFSDARHPTSHSRHHLWQQLILIRQGFPSWKLGATPEVTRVSNSAEGILPYPSVLS